MQTYCMILQYDIEFYFNRTANELIAMAALKRKKRRNKKKLEKKRERKLSSNPCLSNQSLFKYHESNIIIQISSFIRYFCPPPQMKTTLRLNPTLS